MPKPGRRSLRCRAVAAALALALVAPAAARAAEPAPLEVQALQTTDFWRDVTGGLDPGNTVLAKIDLRADFRESFFHRPGLKARLRVIATDGAYLSGDRIGDVQTVSNIEGDFRAHLFEAWVEQAMAGGRVAVRAGLMDMNADFDSITTAGLFLNSSHGIGPDLSRSGLDGPSIFPVTTVGARAQWTPTRRLTLRVAAFDGASGDPGGPGRFLDVTFSGRSGAMMIGEADLALASGVRVAVGGWGYTGRYPLLAAPAASREGQAGVYGFVEGPLPGLSGWRAWVRAGRADPGVDVVAGYLGGGVVRTAPFAGRPDDQLGFAVARALIAADAQRVRGLPDAETTLEASYALQARPWLVVQPDLQYVIHPAGAPAIPSALAIGLRFAVIGVRTEVATHEGF